MLKNTFRKASVNKDGLLKSVLQDTFVDAIRLVIPNADKIFDFSKKIVFLDKELDLLLVDRKKARGRVGDLLVKVARRDGVMQYFLIHIELQAQRDSSFAERMYICNYRIKDKLHLPVTSLAIYADGDSSFCPDHYHEELSGTVTDFRFNTYKILLQDDDELKRSDNIFALVVRAVKIALMKGLEKDELLLGMGQELANEMQRLQLPRSRKFVLLWFLRNYVNFKDPKNIPIFEEAIDTIIHKTKTMGVIEYIKEQARQEERREARKEVKREKNFSFVTNLLQKTRHSVEEIADLAEVSVAFVQQIKKRLESE